MPRANERRRDALTTRPQGRKPSRAIEEAEVVEPLEEVGTGRSGITSAVAGLAAVVTAAALTRAGLQPEARAKVVGSLSGLPGAADDPDCRRILEAYKQRQSVRGR
jgi:hypothetical protein